MLTSTVTLTDELLDKVRKHLFPGGSQIEQGGFLLCATQTDETWCQFIAEDWVPLQRSDYVAQEEDYLELTDAARAGIIKLAHDRQVCLVEVHCHPGKYPACFSRADLYGLREFVPHVRWRLRGHPYAALVFAERSFDGLAFFDQNKTGVPVSRISTGNSDFESTGLTTKIYGAFHYA